MSNRIHSADKRASAIADFRATGDSIAQVAARHGVARSTLGTWVRDHHPEDDDPIAYIGGWELRGGIRYPLFPERRSA